MSLNKGPPVFLRRNSVAQVLQLCASFFLYIYFYEADLFLHFPASREKQKGVNKDNFPTAGAIFFFLDLDSIPFYHFLTNPFTSTEHNSPGMRGPYWCWNIQPEVLACFASAAAA